ncbi:MAG: HutD family protein [bacterium]
MAFEIIRKDQQKISAWAGGKTTQLAIHPPDASYKHMNFLFRLSTATIEKEESEFSILPGVTRQIMILNGRLELQHEGHDSKSLNAFESSTFDGGWKTTGHGKATDFNLMTKGETKGWLEHIRLKPGESLDLKQEIHNDYIAVYLADGEVSFTVVPDGFPVTAQKGDLIILSPGNSNQAMKLNAVRQADLVIAMIRILRHSYHHIGIPTLESKPGEEYLPEHKIYHSGFETSKYGIEWMRYEKGCTMPEIVRNIPHVAFEVSDIHEAVKGKKILIQPNSPSEGVIVALIEENGAPVELLQYVKIMDN